MCACWRESRESSGTVSTGMIGDGLLVLVSVAIKAKAEPLSTSESEMLPKMIAEEIKAARMPNQTWRALLIPWLSGAHLMRRYPGKWGTER